MKRFLMTIILVAGVNCLICLGENTVIASESRFYIPSQYGGVKEVFEAEGNYEAQKNMARVLESLIEQYGLRLILVEGGSGNVSLSFLRGYADKQAREEVAEKYLKMGKISGEEYLNIVSEYEFDLFGIEDEALYEAHMDAFLKIDAIREEGLRYLEGLSNIIDNLKIHIYSENLKQLDEKDSEYEDKEISLVEYCQFLKEMAYRKGLSIWDYPHLVAFSSTAYLENKIDFKQAELQRNAFIKDLARFLDEKGVKVLIDKSQGFKSDEIEPKEYYTFLKNAAEQRINLKQTYPELNAYIRYITQGQDIDTQELLKEVSVIKANLEELCLVNSAQRRLKEISKSLEILVKIFNLELTPEGYEYFRDNRSKFLTASWIDFLTENCRSYNLAAYPTASGIIDDNLENLQGFYQLGTAREEAFIKNVGYKMDESGEKLAVLITGGFHTPGVTQMLKDRGYSYTIVTPVITQRSDSSLYFSVLKGEQNR